MRSSCGNCTSGSCNAGAPGGAARGKGKTMFEAEKERQQKLSTRLVELRGYL
jgi:hypothetical protein